MNVFNKEWQLRERERYREKSIQYFLLLEL